MTRASAGACLLAAVTASSSCAVMAKPKADALPSPTYTALLERAQVWRPVRVRDMNLRTGAPAKDGFAPLATVRCTYKDEAMGGKTPKFTCVLPDGDELKVKYGRENGEVYAEVAATRLLWALGFGADRMYPTRVECKGCPPALAQADVGATAVGDDVIRFEYAAIERKMDGREIESERGAGWSWQDLDRVPPSDPQARAHRDGLKLLAVLLQHTDSKREQQRLVCLDDNIADDPAALAACTRPFMLISDLGKTFGKANAFNADRPGSVNLREWSRTSVWVGKKGCTGNLHPSVTGTLDDPTISEAGRRFLADLLTQLTTEQLRDVFDVARFSDRRAGTDAQADVQAWVSAFKDKVAQITGRSCPETRDPE